MKFSRFFSMPSPDTFTMEPAKALADRWFKDCETILDPFARNCQIGTITNDLNPAFNTDCQLDAPEFLDLMIDESISADGIILDPPFSPRQMAECYKSVGIDKGIEGSQNARLYKQCKDRINDLTDKGAVCISVGWNSNGMGIKRGWTVKEIMLIHCGGAHNDYIFTVEVKTTGRQFKLF